MTITKVLNTEIIGIDPYDVFSRPEVLKGKGSSESHIAFVKARKSDPSTPVRFETLEEMQKIYDYYHVNLSSSVIWARATVSENAKREIVEHVAELFR